jgi:hypothetical protein
LVGGVPFGAGAGIWLGDGGTWSCGADDLAGALTNVSAKCNLLGWGFGAPFSGAGGALSLATGALAIGCWVSDSGLGEGCETGMLSERAMGVLQSCY